jgi:antitoxin VapB
MNSPNKVAKAKQLNLKDPEIHDLAAELARLHGASMAATVKAALREKLQRDRAEAGHDAANAEALAILQRYWALPDGDARSADAILGYDEDGLPT